ncbi:MAG: hypothetical protein DI532_00760 [Azospirillum brasilense]|nr:MAG: hypothetical protein DI532_00760 [Azospirillum brasilense]
MAGFTTTMASACSVVAVPSVPLAWEASSLSPPAPAPAAMAAPTAGAAAPPVATTTPAAARPAAAAAMLLRMVRRLRCSSSRSGSSPLSSGMVSLCGAGDAASAGVGGGAGSA